VQQRTLLHLLSYFRPAKLWDLVTLNRWWLVAARDFKSQVGPSFGNNFNNWAERRLGQRTIFGQRIGREPLGQSPTVCGWRV